MDAKQFIESGILETYAMGLASAEEAKQVADMVARHPEVKAELAAIEASMENFDQQNAVAPPAELKSKILAQIGSVSGSQFPVSGAEERGKVVPLNAEPKQNNFFKYAAGVALILLLGSAAYIFSLSSRLNESEDRIASLEGGLREARISDSMMTLMEQQVTAARNELAILKSPSMKSIELKGMEVAPDAKAMVYANTSNGDSYLEIMNLPAAPDGMQYQFWGIVDGKPVDAGMIPLEGDIAGIHPMKTVPHAAAYAISLEPKGGSQQPQGEIYVMGNS